METDETNDANCAGQETSGRGDPLNLLNRRHVLIQQQRLFDHLVGANRAVDGKFALRVLVAVALFAVLTAASPYATWLVVWVGHAACVVALWAARAGMSHRYQAGGTADWPLLWTYYMSVPSADLLNQLISDEMGAVQSVLAANRAKSRAMGTVDAALTLQLVAAGTAILQATVASG